MQIDIKALVKKDADWFVGQIRKINVFSVLSDRQLMDIVSQMRSYSFKAGTTLVHQGEAANLFFIVQSGAVEVSVKKIFFREKKVAILEAGDFFGESALVSNSKRTATVTAITDTSCFVLLKPSFEYMLNENQLFKRSMKAVYSRRKMELSNA